MGSGVISDENAGTGAEINKKIFRLTVFGQGIYSQSKTCEE
jgi:hypothetical protein